MWFTQVERSNGKRERKPVAACLANSLDARAGGFNATYETNKCISMRDLGFRYVTDRGMPTQLIQVNGKSFAEATHPTVPYGWWLVQKRGPHDPIVNFEDISRRFEESISISALLPPKLNFVFKEIKITTAMHRDLDEFLNLNKRPLQHFPGTF